MAMEQLHHAGVNKRPTKQFPSWIPDWAANRQNSLRSLSDQGMPCAASRRKLPRIEGDPENEFELGVYGIHVDTIKEVSKSANLRDELPAYLDEVERMCNCATSPPAMELRWRIPIANATYGRVEGPRMKESYEALREYFKEEKMLTSLQRAPRPKNVAPIVTRKELWERAQNYVLALQDCLSGWRFVVTHDGHVGVAPPATRQGDTICVAHSKAESCLFILR